MCTFARFEVSPDGELLQSSKVIPPSGVLPRAQATARDPRHTKLYTESVTSTTVTASISSDGEHLRIEGLYFPPPLRGWKLSRLLAPLAIIFIAVYFIVELALIDYHTSQLVHTIFIILAALVVYMVAVFPAALWARHMRTQGAPPVRVQRKIVMNYPTIPAFSDYQRFMVDASTK
jgi:hypothetical protein